MLNTSFSAPTFAFAKYVKVLLVGTVVITKLPSALLAPTTLSSSALIVIGVPGVNPCEPCVVTVILLAPTPSVPTEPSVTTLDTSVSVPGTSNILGYPLCVPIALHFVGCKPYSKSASSIDNGGAIRIRSIASVPKSYGLVLTSGVSM